MRSGRSTCHSANKDLSPEALNACAALNASSFRTAIRQCAVVQRRTSKEEGDNAPRNRAKVNGVNIRYTFRAFHSGFSD